MIEFTINGETVTAAPGTTVAAAILNRGITGSRTSVTGEPRSPICGMGVCFECRVTINGSAHERGCMTVVELGMEVVTDE